VLIKNNKLSEIKLFKCQMKIHKRLIIISLDRVQKNRKKLQFKNRYLIQNSAKTKLNKHNLIPRKIMFLFIQMKALQNSRWIELKQENLYKIKFKIIEKKLIWLKALVIQQK
jgi:hypothetical protein